MTPLPHIVASGIISGLSFFYFKSLGYAAVSFLAGFLIDADHLIDYYLNHGFTLDIKKIYNSCLTIDLKRIYIFLHSYEIILLLWGAIYLFSLSKFWQAIALGLTQHIILDQLTNSVRPGGYFLTNRIAHGFKKDNVVKTVEVR